MVSVPFVALEVFGPVVVDCFFSTMGVSFEERHPISICLILTKVLSTECVLSAVKGSLPGLMLDQLHSSCSCCFLVPSTVETSYSTRYLQSLHTYTHVTDISLQRRGHARGKSAYSELRSVHSRIFIFYVKKVKLNPQRAENHEKIHLYSTLSPADTLF